KVNLLYPVGVLLTSYLVNNLIYVSAFKRTDDRLGNPDKDINTPFDNQDAAMQAGFQRHSEDTLAVWRKSCMQKEDMRARFWLLHEKKG
ncbi:MAG: hypothetical protein Q9196_006365, partial [Gyalolechia fulgens]